MIKGKYDRQSFQGFYHEIGKHEFMECLKYKMSDVKVCFIIDKIDGDPFSYNDYLTYYVSIEKDVLKLL